MPAKTPAEVHSLFSEFFATNRIDDLLSLYEPTAVLVPQPGCPVSGHSAIRAALSTFLAINGEFKLHPPRVIETGEIALLFANWTLTGKTPDGSAVNLSGQTSDVVKRQTDGSWLYVIDSPFGAAGAP